MVGVMLGENFGGWNFGFKKFCKKWRNSSWISMILSEDSRLPGLDLKVTKKKITDPKSHEDIMGLVFLPTNLP